MRDLNRYGRNRDGWAATAHQAGDAEKPQTRQGGDPGDRWRDAALDYDLTRLTDSNSFSKHPPCAMISIKLFIN